MCVRPRIAVFAYSEVGYLCLKQLARDGANVVCVYTHEDDPGEHIWFHSVKDEAARLGLPVRTPKKLDAAELAYLAELAPELVLSFYYRALIPREILEMPRLGAYNVHGALLPAYRGRACVNWAVLNGETETGVTLHVMTEKADRGDIVAQRAFPIAFTDTALDVFMNAAEAARIVTEDNLPALEAGTARRVPQDESRATYFGRRRPENGRIDWNKSAVEIYNLIRAVTHPFPGAFAEFGAKKYYIWKAWPLEGSAPPGTIVSESPLVAGTGRGLLRIDSIEPDGLKIGEKGDGIQ